MKLVTAAIIINSGKVLIAQRAENQNQAGKWEFPGGKVEPGETPEECLKREIKEELGINIEVKDFFGESIYHYDTGAIKLIAYKAQWTDGEYKLTAHSQIKWVKPQELDNYDFAPADICFVERLKRENGQK
ncbi:MAG TPA: 8-oxo-dGTP diphosphatase MutT [Clostridiaceae bacterium]|nr:8-oxo-dGTP diphosphatase MutT [Clostridiaceae bacterium]